MKTTSASATRLNLRDVAQLFNSLDSSPFVDRDLDAPAEEFIVNWARELPPENELELVITLAAPAPADRVGGIENAIRRYFGTRASIKQLEFTQLMKRGRLSLFVGLLFLVLCLLLGNSLNGVGDNSFSGILKEGLTIAGWVAMWRPLEIYLYDWWPIYEERRRLERLARIEVRVIITEHFLPGPLPEEEAFPSPRAQSAA